MAAPTKPFQQYDEPLDEVVAPAGFSRYSVGAGKVRTVTFQALTRYVEVVSDGTELQVGRTSTGVAGTAYNTIGGAWPVAKRIPGQMERLVISNGTGGAADVELLVVVGTPDSAVMGGNDGAFEGSNDPHDSTTT